MLRSFIPFVLASLGFAMILYADRSPLYEWQVSEVVTEVPSDCNFHLSTHWVSRLGESFDDTKTDNVKIIVNRSRIDKTLEQLSLALDKTIPWMSIGVFFSIGYIWWFLPRGNQNRIPRVAMAVFLTGMAAFICLLLSQVVRLAGPAIGSQIYYYFGKNCQGAITFSAEIIKIFYETLLILFLGILMEVGAFGVLQHQFKMVIAEENESLQLAAG